MGVAVAVLKATGWGGSGSVGSKISKAASKAIICSSKKPPTRKGAKLERDSRGVNCAFFGPLVA